MTYYDTLVLSAGAVKGSLILGGLQYCGDNKLIENIRHYIGTSVGAIISYLLCIGCSPTEIIVYLCTHPIFKEVGVDVVGMMQSMLSNEGIMRFAPITEWLERITINKVGKLLTMGDIQTRFNKTLTIVTYNYSKRHAEYITSENRPDMPCLIALKMSCSVPILFGAFKYEENMYIDGAICDRFPIAYPLPSQSQTKRLGFVINPETTCTDTECTDTRNIIHYIYDIMTIPIVEKYKHTMSQAHDADIIPLHTSSINSLDFTVTPSMLIDMFSEGYTQTKAFFDGEN